MRNRFFATLFVTLIAGTGICMVSCSGSPSARSPATTPPDDGPEADADPLAAACAEGNVKSCLSAGQSAQSRGDVAAAVRWFGRACEEKEPAGCVFAGQVVIEDDAPAAASWFERGCALGDATSCYAAGVAWSGLYEGANEPKRSAEAFRRGCDAGMPEACGQYAGALAAGVGVAANPEEAARLRARACDAGDGTSCIALADELRADDDFAGAQRRLTQACESDGRGCTLLGLLAVEAQDAETARQWFERGCVATFSDPDACGWYGWHVWSGFGGAKSEPEGLSLLEASCDAPSAIGCTFRAVIAAGAGEDAQAYLRRACDADTQQCDALSRQFEVLSGRQ